MSKIIKKEIKRIIEAEYIDKITKADIKLMQSPAWQNPGQLVISNNLFSDLTIESKGEKKIGGDLFEIKKHCRNAYNTSPNVGSVINRFSSWIWGDNSFVYSDYEIVQNYLDDFMSDWFNDLDTGISEIVTNMFVDGESFPMITILNSDGDQRIRLIEDLQIKGGKDNYGLITDPDDITVTAFYIIDAKEGKKIIPDINVLWNPSLYDKIKSADIKDFDNEKTKSSKLSGNAGNKIKNAIGTPFKQFIVPWKNLMGIKNQLRSVSSIRRAIESDNNYDNMLKYTMDFFKAAMSYTDVFEFTEDRAGILAFNWVANKMQTEDGRKELYNIGITKPKAPGDTVITRPGMKYKKVAPQLSTAPMSGYFKDFLNRIAAGLETPGDMVSADSSDSTFASLKMSRQAPQLWVWFCQWRLDLYLRTRFFRSVFKIKSALDTKFPKTIPIKQYFQSNVSTKNELKEVKRNLPIWHKDILKICLPDVDLSNDEGRTKALFGSKHRGSIAELGLSREKAAKKLDIGDFTLQQRMAKKEEDIYGKREILGDKEALTEVSDEVPIAKNRKAKKKNIKEDED